MHARQALFGLFGTQVGSAVETTEVKPIEKQLHRHEKERKRDKSKGKKLKEERIRQKER